MKYREAVMSQCQKEIIDHFVKKELTEQLRFVIIKSDGEIVRKDVGECFKININCDRALHDYLCLEYNDFQEFETYIDLGNEPTRVRFRAFTYGILGVRFRIFLSDSE